MQVAGLVVETAPPDGRVVVGATDDIALAVVVDEVAVLVVVVLVGTVLHDDRDDESAAG